MSCIGVHINRLDGISASTHRLDGISAGVHRIEGCACNVSRIDGCACNASRIEAMQVHVSVMCGIEDGNYLIVTPNYLWVTSWDVEIVDVKSNTDWKVD